MSFWRRATPEQRARQQVQAALTRVQSASDRAAALPILIAALRPRRPEDTADAERRLHALALLLSADEAARAALRETLLHLLSEKQLLRLLTDSGILEGEGFFSGLWRRLGQRLLPPERNPDSLKDLLAEWFDRPGDHLWTAAVPPALWVLILDTLELPSQLPTAGRLRTQLLDALQVLSHRIAAIGLEPELVRNHPDIERYESPFLMQNAELHAFVAERKQAALEKRAPTLDDKHLLVLLDQCEDIIAKVRKQAAQTGASVSLTHLLLRLSQNITRLHSLLRLLEDRAAHALNEDRVALFVQLLRAENRRLSLTEFWSQNVELLAQRITGNASKTGEHYVTSTRSEYFLMLRSALGAGFIVAFMALLKVDMGREPHAPIVSAVLYSLNYGLGFVLIYILRFTIATKQPAMTASYLAASLQASEGRDRLDQIEEQIVRTVRSQFIAIFGNVFMALLVPALLVYLLLMQTDAHFLAPEQAQALLDQQNPLTSLAWFHAAIAGVCLFLSGLISGYFDNKAVYDRIPARIRQLRWLRRVIGERGAQRFSEYIEANLGGLAGNFFFGCMLGSMGTLGFILGLPLDIRHITFSTAYLTMSFVALDWDLSLAQWALPALGVLGIGLINLVVSFGLALYVALRAQRVEFTETRRLLARVLQRLWRRPRDFLWPPRETSKPAPPAE